MSSEPLRLQKFLALHGIESRRYSESLIRDGLVRVNGRTATLGNRVDPRRDTVTVKGKRIVPESGRSCLLALNKPKGYLCSNFDPHYRRTIFDLIPPDFRSSRLFCAGRLDKDSEGLVIVTNEGDFCQKLTHPSMGVIKRYWVTIDRPFLVRHRDNLIRGIVLEGERLRAIKVVVSEKGKRSARHFELHLREGRKREIRRMLKALGYRVDRIFRFQIGGYRMRGIGPGHVRPLGNKEKSLLLG